MGIVPEWFTRLLKLGRAQKAYQNKSMRVKTKRIKNSARIQESRVRDLSPEERLVIGAQDSQLLRDYANGPLYSLAGDVTTMFTRAVQDRRDYLETASELKMYPIAKRILDILSKQILKPDKRGRILELTCDREDVNEELQKFVEDQHLDNWLTMICKDVLNMGEYTLRVECEEGQGVTAITDTVDQLGVVAFYDRGEPQRFLVLRRDNYYLEPASNYAHFVIGEEKIRLALNDTLHRTYQIDYDKLPDEYKNKIPEFVRVGEPIFFAVVEKIRQLQILEQVVLAIKLSAVTQRKLVALQVPATMPVDKVMEACKKFEETLNTQTGVDESIDMVSVSEIMSQAGRYTVIPQYTDDKGTLTPLDVRHDPQVDDVLNAIDDYRETLLTSVGIPYRLVYGARKGGDTQERRGDEIRTYAMFSDMINGIQQSMAGGAKHVALIHLLNKGYQIKAKEINARFLNSSVNVGDLEKLDYDDAKQEYAARKIDFLIKMIGEEAAMHLLMENANEEGILEWISESFNSLTDGIPLFMTKQEQPNSDGFIPLGQNKNKPERVRVLKAFKDAFVQSRLVRKQQLEPQEDSSINLEEPHPKKIEFLKMVRDNLRDNLGIEPPESSDSNGHSTETKTAFLKAVRDKFRDRLDKPPDQE